MDIEEGRPFCRKLWPWNIDPPLTQEYQVGQELLLPELPLTIRLIGLRVTKLKDLRLEPSMGIKRVRDFHQPLPISLYFSFLTPQIPLHRTRNDGSLCRIRQRRKIFPHELDTSKRPQSIPSPGLETPNPCLLDNLNPTPRLVHDLLSPNCTPALYVKRR
jgi:hypothetical protein